MAALATLSCVTCGEKSTPNEAESGPTEDEASEFEGDWVLVGFAHPWHQRDLFGYSGIASIRGSKIAFTFIRSPLGSLDQNKIPMPLFEGKKAFIEYSGELVEIESEASDYWRYTIQGTDSVFDDMPLYQWPGLQDSILIGHVDPPFMFRSEDAPPIGQVKDGEGSDDFDYSNIADDPFALDEHSK